MENNLSEAEYNALVRDAMLWRKQQMSVPDGWTSVRTTFYNELLAEAQVMDPGEEPDYSLDGSPKHGPYPGQQASEFDVWWSKWTNVREEYLHHQYRFVASAAYAAGQNKEQGTA